jgi:hypothetical protein
VLLPLRIAKPESFAFDAAGNLYIADNEEDILYLVTADGRLRRPIARREGFSPESLHFSGGVLFITDSANGKLHRYSPEDGLTTFAVFAGELANVQGITSDDAGSLYVSVQSDLKARPRLYPAPQPRGPGRERPAAAPPFGSRHRRRSRGDARARPPRRAGDRRRLPWRRDRARLALPH